MSKIRKLCLVGMVGVVAAVVAFVIALGILFIFPQSDKVVYNKSVIKYDTSLGVPARLIQDVFTTRVVINFVDNCEYVLIIDELNDNNFDLVPVIKNGEQVCQDELTSTSKE